MLSVGKSLLKIAYATGLCNPGKWWANAEGSTCHYNVIMSESIPEFSEYLHIMNLRINVANLPEAFQWWIEDFVNVLH